MDIATSSFGTERSVPITDSGENKPRTEHLVIEMPRNARCVAAGLPYHVTQRGTNRQRLFYGATDYRLYLSLVRRELEDAGVRVLAYCLMTNHVHLVVIADREDSLAVLFRRAHGRYAQSFNVRRGRSGHLFQQRFYSCPLSEQHLWIALRYVEQNPCRAGLVELPEEYRWSSAAARMGCGPDRARVLDEEFWADAGGAETWRELHGAELTAAQAMELRRCTYAGRPFGEEPFVQRMEAQFQRVWRRPESERMAAGG